MYTVVCHETGTAFEFPSREAYRDASAIVSEMDDRNPGSRDRIYAFCAERGVALRDGHGNLMRDWIERAEWCVAWDRAKPTPSHLLEKCKLPSAEVVVGDSAYTISFCDQNGRSKTPEAHANAQLFMVSADLADAARALLSGDRKAKRRLAEVLARLDPPQPRTATGDEVQAEMY